MKERNLSIDIFRGLTMALMVFVNDLWTVHDVPQWMMHTATHTDGMGLADFVFPMFLFVMGMSVPYALENRISRGQADGEIIRHILGRTLALLVMGVFIYNGERGTMVCDRGVYHLLMLTGFFLVWNRYPEGFRARRWLRLAGVLLLAVLAITYRTSKGEWFQAGWWGILGIIGWTYLFSATAWLLCRRRPWILGFVWAVLCFVNLSVVPMRGSEAWIGKNILADFTGALHLGNGYGGVLALGGMLTVLAGQSLAKGKAWIGFGAAILLAALGWCAHQGWILSKNIGTLPWCLYVCALSVALYSLLRILEKRGWTGWASPLRPAGVATLTVYIIPYFFYAIRHFLALDSPAWLCGYPGTLKCILFAALCIATAWALGKCGIRLKV